MLLDSITLPYTITKFIVFNYFLQPIYYLLNIAKFFLLLPWIPVGYILEIDHINSHKALEFLNLVIQYAIVNIFISAVIARLIYNNLSVIYNTGKTIPTLVENIDPNGSDSSARDEPKENWYQWDDKWKSYTNDPVAHRNELVRTDNIGPGDDTNITIPEPRGSK